MRGNFERSLSHVGESEGGYSNHPRDPGGSTMRGITQTTFNHHLMKLGRMQRDVRSITDDEVRAIYKSQYWNKVRGEELRHGVDLTMFDFAVNSGPGRAIRHLQKFLTIEVDGQIGPKTLGAAKRSTARKIIKGVNASRLGFMRSLNIWSTFKGGWSKRVARVEATSLSMVLAPYQMEEEIAEAKTRVNKNAAVTTTGGAGAGGAGIAQGDISNIDWVLLAILIVGVMVAVGFGVRMIIQSQRGRALKKALVDMRRKF